MADLTENRGNAAIFFVPNEFSRDRGKLMGRQSAGEAFVKAFARHGEVDPYFSFSPRKEAAETFLKRINQARRERNDPRPARVKWIPMHRLDGLREPGCMMTYDPGLPKWAWQRQFFGADAFSICGITHTTASHSVMDSLGNLPLAPVHPWDALICTSRCVRDTAERIVDGWRDYLGARLGADKFTLPMLPVIPLGVDCDGFADSPERQATRAAFRQKHGIGDDDIVVLFLGRLSFHAKAHPFPMYLALEETVHRTGKRLHLIQTGWYGNEPIERAFKTGARDFAPSVNAIFCNGRDPADRAGSWAAADIFSSLSDNVQETFGLTPIEAMASGLPQVVTDWDGYRDTVRHGVDGFAIPTVTPPDGTGALMARDHALDNITYDQYIGFTCFATAVDIGKAADAYTALVQDPELRRKMGEAGRRRAREVFDQPHVINAYQNLWHEMKARRLKDGPAVAANPALQGHPSRRDPFDAFAGYPTRRFDDDTLIKAGELSTLPNLTMLRGHGLTNLGNPVMVDEQACDAILSTVTGASRIRVGGLLDSADTQERRNRLYRTVGWLLKMGLLELADED